MVEQLLGVIGTIFTAGVPSLITFYITKRKYHSEVETTDLDNSAKEFSLYKQLIEDQNKQIAKYIQLSEANLLESTRLRDMVNRILNSACLDSICTKRVYYNEAQIREFLSGKPSNNNNNETTSE